MLPRARAKDLIKISEVCRTFYGIQDRCNRHRLLYLGSDSFHRQARDTIGCAINARRHCCRGPAGWRRDWMVERMVYVNAINTSTSRFNTKEFCSLIRKHYGKH
jgi:hypothetical protein